MIALSPSRRGRSLAWLTALLGTACSSGSQPGTIAAEPGDAGVGLVSAPLVQEDTIDGETLPEGYISLTYDDGPGASTLEIARLLHREGIQATFFVNGCRLIGQPDPGPGADADCVSGRSRYPVSVLYRLVQLGHRIANHTQDHAGFGARTPAERVAGIAVLQPTLDRYIDDDVWLFRPPGIDWPTSTEDYVNAHPTLSRLLGPFGHTVPGYFAQDGGAPADPCAQHEDWRCLDPSRDRTSPRPPGDPVVCATQLAECAFRDSRARGIVMLHDRRPDPLETDPRYRLNTLRYTETLIPWLREREYAFVPLDAIPGVLGPRRFDFHASRRTSPELSDPRDWGTDPAYYRTLRATDLDGDGSVEICGRGNTGLRCVTATSTGFSTGRTWTSAFSDSHGFRQERYAATLMFGDVDRDGDDDACMRGPDGVYCAATAGRGTGLPARATRFTAEFSNTSPWGSDESLWGSLRLVDVTGDGRADLCGRGPTGIVCAASRSTRFAPATPWMTTSFGPADSDPGYGTTLAFGDLDGDGDPDACMRHPLGVRCALNSGLGFGTATEWARGPFSDLDRWTTPGTYGSIRLVDVDGDGDSDICGRATTGVVCAFSNGRAFLPYQYLANDRMRDADGWGDRRYGSTLLFADLDRDGVADVCGRSAGGLDCALGTAALRAP